MSERQVHKGHTLHFGGREYYHTTGGSHGKYIGGNHDYTSYRGVRMTSHVPFIVKKERSLTEAIWGEIKWANEDFHQDIFFRSSKSRNNTFHISHRYRVRLHGVRLSYGFLFVRQ